MFVFVVVLLFSFSLFVMGDFATAPFSSFPTVLVLVPVLLSHGVFVVLSLMINCSFILNDRYLQFCD